MDDCIFCKISAGEIPSEIVHRDEQFIAFKDISPLAPVHLLIIPRRHVTSLQSVTEAESGMIGQMAMIAKKLAAQFGVNETGYRVVINTGAYGGQLIKHLHMHLLGGKKLGDKLG